MCRGSSCWFTAGGWVCDKQIQTGGTGGGGLCGYKLMKLVDCSTVTIRRSYLTLFSVFNQPKIINCHHYFPLPGSAWIRFHDICDGVSNCQPRGTVKLEMSLQFNMQLWRSDSHLDTETDTDTYSTTWVSATLHLTISPCSQKGDTNQHFHIVGRAVVYIATEKSLQFQYTQPHLHICTDVSATI